MAGKRNNEDGAGGSGSSAAATETIIAQFGGLRPMASKLGMAVSTAQGWKERGHIPGSRVDALREAARSAGIALKESDLKSAAKPPSGEKPARKTAAADQKESVSRSTKPDAVTKAPHRTSAQSAPPEPDEPEATIEIVEDSVTGETIETVLIEHKRGLTGVTALLALIIGVAALVSPYLSPEIRSILLLPPREGVTAPTGELEIFRSRIDELEASNARLSEQIAALRSLEVPQAAEIAEAATEAATAAATEAAIVGAADAIQEEFSSRFSSLAEAQEAAGDRAEAGFAQVRARIDQVENAPPDTTMADKAREGRQELSLRIDAASQRLDAINDQLSVVDDQLAALRAIGDRLDAHSVKLGALGGGADTTSLQVREVSDRVNDLERIARINRATSPREAAVLLAVGQLRTALTTNYPFDSELETLRRMLGPGVSEMPQLESAINAAEKAARVGAPSLTDLQSNFPAAAKLTAAAALAPQGESWLDRTMSRLTGLISVRRIEDDGSDTTMSHLARAESLLESGDIDGAVQAVSQIHGSIGAPMQDWVDGARSRVAANSLGNALSAGAIDRLTSLTRPSGATE